MLYWRRFRPPGGHGPADLDGPFPAASRWRSALPSTCLPPNCRRAAGPVLLAAAGLLLAAATAHAADRWQEAGSGAVAILPEPAQATGIIGGSLYCAEQRWAFRLRLAPGAVADGWSGPVALSVGDDRVQAAAVEAGGALDVPVDPGFLAPLRAGNRLRLDGGDLVSATFPLRGSAATIDAIAPRCSPVDMSRYERVVLSPADPGVGKAKDLLKDEIRLYRRETGREPEIAAATMALAQGRGLLFATLCGSTAWYGPSGCTLSGHAAETLDGEWRQVYGTEGLDLYTDPAVSNGGWPDLLSLSRSSGAQAERWTWSGGGYVNAAEIAADEAAQADPPAP